MIPWTSAEVVPLHACLQHAAQSEGDMTLPRTPSQGGPSSGPSIHRDTAQRFCACMQDAAQAASHAVLCRGNSLASQLQALG